nr:hypothetical protein [Microctonus hyperodae filamentous virus]
MINFVANVDGLQWLFCRVSGPPDVNCPDFWNKSTCIWVKSLNYLVTLVFDAIIADCLPPKSPTTRVIIVTYTINTCAFTNFDSGIKVDINYNMAYLFRNNTVYYPMEQESLNIHQLINVRVYQYLRDVMKLDDIIAYDYCELLFKAILTRKKIKKNVEKIIQQHPDDALQVQALMQELFNDSSLHSATMTEAMDNVDVKEKISPKFVQYIQQMYHSCAIDSTDSPNFIANKHLENKMQNSLSVKKMAALKIDGADGGGGGNGSLMENVLIYDNIDLSLLANNSLHYNIGNVRLYRFRINVTEIFLQKIIDLHLIFFFLLYKPYVVEKLLDVSVYVYENCIIQFIAQLKRYIVKYERMCDAKFNIIQEYSINAKPIDRKFLEAKSAVFIKKISQAKMDQCIIADCFITSKLKKKMEIFHAKKNHDIIEVYVIIYEKVLINVLRQFSCIFSISMKIAFKDLTFYYIHFFLHKNICKDFYQYLHKSMGNVGASIQQSPEHTLDLLWYGRARVQLIYTSDFNGFDCEKNREKFLRNVLLYTYIKNEQKIFPVPANAEDANTFIYYLLRIAKSIAFRRESLFHVNNYIDGPLNNIVSIKGIQSLVDDRINDKTYKCNCTTVCTLLNCPLYTGIQNPQNFVTL